VAHDEHAHEHEHDHDEALDDEQARADAEAEAEREARRQFALAQIRQYGDPALRMRAADVAEFDADLQRLVERMTGLMHDAQGVGLAATQVGVLRRVFVFEPAGEEARVVVNPVVVSRGAETEADEEGCLSLQGVRVPVERSTAITLEGKDAKGDAVHFELDPYASRVVQHELDHLDGVLIIDRTDDEHRKEALSTLRPRVVLR
jgi:peptide deformylase